jgi:hypothetical protein
MCSCTSCYETDIYGGLPSLFGWQHKNPHPSGFTTWPRGEPAGQRSSESAYRAHVAHSRAGVSKTIAFTPGQAQRFPTVGIASPLPQPTALVRDWIAASYARADGRNVFPGRDAKYVRKSTPRLVTLARELRRAA